MRKTKRTPNTTLRHVERVSNEEQSLIRLIGDKAEPTLELSFTKPILMNLDHPHLSWERVRTHYLDPEQQWVRSMLDLSQTLTVVEQGIQTTQAIMGPSEGVTWDELLGMKKVETLREEAAVDVAIRPLHALDLTHETGRVGFIVRKESFTERFFTIETFELICQQLFSAPNEPYAIHPKWRGYWDRPMVEFLSTHPDCPELPLHERRLVLNLIWGYPVEMVLIELVERQYLSPQAWWKHKLQFLELGIGALLTVGLLIGWWVVKAPAWLGLTILSGGSLYFAWVIPKLIRRKLWALEQLNPLLKPVSR